MPAGVIVSETGPRIGGSLNVPSEVDCIWKVCTAGVDVPSLAVTVIVAMPAKVAAELKSATASLTSGTSSALVMTMGLAGVLFGEPLLGALSMALSTLKPSTNWPKMV